MEIEGHPIPQDITGFQFKLVGDMTVKQFVFLGAGLLVGWLLFSLPLPLLIKGPLAGMVALSGFFFAFAPIRGRSADTMVLLFFKALFKPNQFTYNKTQQTAHVGAAPVSPTPPQEEKPEETVMLQQAPTLPIPPPSVEEPPTIEPPSIEASEPVTVLEQELTQAKTIEEHESGTLQAQEAHTKVLELERQMQELLAQKQALEKHVVTLQQQINTKPEPVFSPTDIPATTPRVRTVPQPLKKEVGVPLALDVPNVLIGIVKDARGNVLQNILIEVKDKEGNPVRAFKTNPLGQFASATPLANGTYTVTFEDPKKQQKFDTISLAIDGSIVKPLEVISVDEREELRKSLFSN